MKVRYDHILGIVAASITVIALLHSANRALSALVIRWFPQSPEHVVYVCITVIEVTAILSMILLIKTVFVSDSPHARRLGLWIEHDEIIIDIRKKNESLNTMNISYRIRKRTVNNIRFWSGSGPVEANRRQPQISIGGLPDGTSYKTDEVTTGNRRYYNIHFSPPLKAGFRPLKLDLSIRELTRGQYYSSQKDIPADLKDEFSAEGFDYVQERIGLHTKKLTLRVIFQPGFVPISKGYIGARLGFSETPLKEEEERLSDSVTLSPGHNDRRELTASIAEPILGATYFLLWKPPYSYSK